MFRLMRMGRFGWVLGLLVLPVLLAMRGSGGAGFPLDAAGGVGGIPFGASEQVVPGLRQSLGLVGKRRRTTHLYFRPGDTTRVHGLAGSCAYWFRSRRFEGVTIDLPGADALTQAKARLTDLYGPARPDTLPNSWYWLGQRSYVLLEEAYPRRRGAIVMLASLAMLNEQVHEAAVRAQARRRLGWQPDSVGLPRQFPSR